MIKHTISDKYTIFSHKNLDISLFSTITVIFDIKERAISTFMIFG